MGRRQIRLRLIKPLAEPREPYLRNDGFDLEPMKKPKLDLSDVQDYDGSSSSSIFITSFASS